MRERLVCGLDVGTGGVRAVLVDENGNVVARVGKEFKEKPYAPAPGLHEQNAQAWWESSKECLQEIAGFLGDYSLDAIAVDSTSGTLVAVDAGGKPLMPAIMYNDTRATDLAREVNEAGKGLCAEFGYAFAPTFSIVKMVWLVRNCPELVERAYKLLHSADFIVGKLTGNFNCTDTSNALKSGVNLLTGEFPEFLERKLGLPLEKLPEVFQPGEKVGEVSDQVERETGIPAGTAVVAGATDGTASFFASGASRPGDWNITLGTTLVLRGISKNLIKPPDGRLYCHRHPEGYWLPGGASNAGGEAIEVEFGKRSIEELDLEAEGYLPTALVVYPLRRRGERLPFASDSAEGFVLGEARTRAELFAGYAEGIALVSLWILEEAEKLGADVGGSFFATGGGSEGRCVMKALASVLARSVSVPELAEGSMGSALLAGGWAWFDRSLSTAQARMVRKKSEVLPNQKLGELLREKLIRLKEECAKRGYL